MDAADEQRHLVEYRLGPTKVWHSSEMGFEIEHGFKPKLEQKFASLGIEGGLGNPFHLEERKRATESKGCLVVDGLYGKLKCQDKPV